MENYPFIRERGGALLPTGRNKQSSPVAPKAELKEVAGPNFLYKITLICFLAYTPYNIIMQL